MIRKMITAFSAFAVAILAFAPVISVAQGEDIRKKIIPSLELQDADVRDALRLMFDNVGVQNYSIASDVQGTITIKLTNVTFETALRSVLDQVDATYSFEAGMVRIFKRERITIDPTQPASGAEIPSTKVTRRIQILHADPLLIAILLRGEGAMFGLPPELSTSMGAGGGQFGGGGFGGGGQFGGGGFGGGFGGGGFGGGNRGGGGFGGGGFGGGGFGGGGFRGGGGGGGGGFRGGGGR